MESPFYSETSLIEGQRTVGDGKSVLKRMGGFYDGLFIKLKRRCRRANQGLGVELKKSGFDLTDDVRNSCLIEPQYVVVVLM